MQAGHTVVLSSGEPGHRGCLPSLALLETGGTNSKGFSLYRSLGKS